MFLGMQGKYLSFTTARICYEVAKWESWSREWAADLVKAKKLSKVWENKERLLNDYIPAGSLHPSIFHPQGRQPVNDGVGQTHGRSWENLFVFPVHRGEKVVPCVTQLSDIGQKARTKGLRDGWMGERKRWRDETPSLRPPIRTQIENQPGSRYQETSKARPETRTSQGRSAAVHLDRVLPKTAFYS